MADLKHSIADRISSAPTARVWTPVDFLDLGSRDGVDKVLQRLVQAGQLRRIDRGLYETPRIKNLTKRPGLKRSVAAERDMDVVGEAANGQDAFRCVGVLKPAIVLMDVSMPGWSGVLTTQKVTEAYEDVKVIGVSRHDDVGTVRAMIEAGARGYVLKQSTSKDLVDAIRTVAAGGTYIDRAIRTVGILETDEEPDTRKGGEAPVRITPSEEDVLRLVARSHTTEEIGNLLSISTAEAATLRSDGMRKARLSSRVQIVAYARMRGWMDDR